jgi:hypothetical protein
LFGEFESSQFFNSGFKASTADKLKKIQPITIASYKVKSFLLCDEA